MDNEEWYRSGYRGRAPPIEYGQGTGFRVKDLWCSVWYIRFVGSKKECEEWIKKEKETLPGVTMLVEKEPCREPVRTGKHRATTNGK